MRAMVLLSSGRHPVSGDAVLPRLEAQAIRLAAGFCVRGLHAGPEPKPVADALGQGLAHLQHLRTPPGADPIPYLAAALSAERPDLILAGRRGQGGAETGLVPYALAKALALPIVVDAVSVALGADAGTLFVEQALPKGTRRRLTIRLPAIVTVHPSAAPPRPFAYGQARRGRLETVEHPIRGNGPQNLPLFVEERPFRSRPKVIRAPAAGATAAERLQAATGAARGTAHVLVHPAPDVAAREILAYLRGVGVLRASATLGSLPNAFDGRAVSADQTRFG